MARPKTYDHVKFADGFQEVELSSWKYFNDYIRKEMLDHNHYFWRGQRDSSWGLETTIDRLIGTKKVSEQSKIIKKHLECFQMSSRGRRGLNPPRDMSENEWWALGQHHSLATPLLDWTTAPFVALYFAFEKEQAPKSGKRVIWSLYPSPVNTKIRKQNPSEKSPPILEVIKPHQDENARLVSQSGLFTRAPIGETVVSWVKNNCVGYEHIVLMKISMPDKDREDCLKALNRMNINHLTLFPDLYGAGQYCNNFMSINRY